MTYTHQAVSSFIHLLSIYEHFISQELEGQNGQKYKVVLRIGQVIWYH